MSKAITWVEGYNEYGNIEFKAQVGRFGLLYYKTASVVWMWSISIEDTEDIYDVASGATHDPEAARQKTEEALELIWAELDTVFARTRAQQKVGGTSTSEENAEETQ